MLHRVMTAGLQDIVKANHIAFYVYVWVKNGIADACLRGEIDYNIRVMLLKDAVNKILVRKISLDEGIISKLLEFRQTRLFDADIVVVIHVIKANNLSVWLCGQDAFDQIGADKAGCSGDKIVLLI